MKTMEVVGVHAAAWNLSKGMHELPHSIDYSLFDDEPYLFKGSNQVVTYTDKGQHNVPSNN